MVDSLFSSFFRRWAIQEKKVFENFTKIFIYKTKCFCFFVRINFLKMAERSEAKNAKLRSALLASLRSVIFSEIKVNN